MIALATGETLQAVLAGAVASVQPSYYTSFIDSSDSTPGNLKGALNSTTDVNIVTAPSSGVRLVKNIFIRNRDTAAVTVTIKTDVSGTEVELFSTVLAPGETLFYAPETGFVVRVNVSMPTGAIIPYGAAAAPSGFLLCDGAAVLRTTYAALFAVISTTYGAGDNSTTFNVPDLRARFAVGYNASGTLGEGDAARTNKALAASGGGEVHTLTTAQMPAHNHTISGGGNFVRYVSAGTGGHVYAGSAALFDYPIAMDNAGGGGSHNNMPPYLGVNFIIKT